MTEYYLLCLDYLGLNQQSVAFAPTKIDVTKWHESQPVKNSSE